MGKLFGLLVVALTAAVFIALAGSVDTAAQRTGGSADEEVVLAQEVPPMQVDVCYTVQDGHTVEVDARLVTQNFGGDLVGIRQLVGMCELSTKSVGGPGPQPPPPADTRILACYSLRGGASPDDPYKLTTNNFGEDVVSVSRSTLMCESATKRVYDETGNLGSPIGVQSGLIQQCFTLKDGENPGVSVLLANNNFGREEVRVGRSTLMCEEAEKHRLVDGVVEVTGFANGVVSQCFGVIGGADQKQRVVLDTENFGRDEVIVRQARTMCEIAEKDPIYTVTFSFPDR